MPREISDKTTARSFTRNYWQLLSKDVSANGTLKNWITMVKDLRETPGSWIKWNMMTKPVEEPRLKIISEKGFLVVQSLRDSVCYVVDLSDVPKCGSFNPYGNEQMKNESKGEMGVDFKLDNPTTWGIDEVYEWAMLVGGEASANSLRDQEITGKDLLANNYTQADLERWGIKGGPAGRIISAINVISSKEDQPSSTTKVFYDLSLPWYFRVMVHCRSSLTV